MTDYVAIKSLEAMLRELEYLIARAPVGEPAWNNLCDAFTHLKNAQEALA